MSDPMTTNEISPDDKNMALIAAVLGIFTFWVGPLIIFLIKKDQSNYVAYHALQSCLIGACVFVAGVLAVIPIVGWLIYVAVVIGNLVLQIQAAMAINKGEWFNAPVAGQFVRQQLKLA